MENLKSTIFLAFILLAGCPSSSTTACAGGDCWNSPLVSCLSFALTQKNFPELGIGQSIGIVGDFIYLFGDASVGTVIELDMNLNPTGWVGHLTVNGKDQIPHPSGIAFHEGKPTFIGSLVGTTGFLYQVDWNQFLQDKTLDRALIHIIQDTASSSGSRPEYIEIYGEWLIATTDYQIGSHSELRILDPNLLTMVNHTLEEGVILSSMTIPPFVQELFWSEETDSLVLIRNKTRTSGWALSFIPRTFLELPDHGNLNTLMDSYCLDYDTELEGYAELADGRRIFLDAAPSHQLSVYVP